MRWCRGYAEFARGLSLSVDVESGAGVGVAGRRSRNTRAFGRREVDVGSRRWEEGEGQSSRDRPERPEEREIVDVEA